MAAILSPTSDTLPDANSRFGVLLVMVLAAFTVGVAMMLSGAVRPASPSHLGVALPAFAGRSPAAQVAGAAAHAASGFPRRSHIAGAMSSAGHRSGATTTFDRPGGASRATVPADVVARSRTGTANNVMRDVARGIRAESAHLGTTPLQADRRDVRWDLLDMAAAQHRVRSRSCPCPVDVGNTSGMDLR
jgi:hypothetical protein